MDTWPTFLPAHNKKAPREAGQSTGNKVPEGDNVIAPRSRLLEVFVAVLAVDHRDRRGGLG
jgi:hypothetical protein